MTHWHYSTE